MKQVYLTMCNSTNYLKGVYILNRSLIDVKSKHDLIVMIPDENNLELKNFLIGNNIKFIEVKLNLNVKTKNEYYWEKTFDKLAMFGLTQFDKIVFLDCDMIILKNIDDLFMRENMSAVVAGKCIAGNENFTKLNSGLMVIKPNNETLNNLIKLIPEVVEKKSFCGDQDVIQEYFVDWEENSHLELPQEYNFFFEGINGCYLERKIRLDYLKVIHFVGKFKPWMREYKSYFKKIKFKQQLKALLHCDFKAIKFENEILNKINKYLQEIKNDSKQD